MCIIMCVQSSQQILYKKCVMPFLKMERMTLEGVHMCCCTCLLPYVLAAAAAPASPGLHVMCMWNLYLAVQICFTTEIRDVDKFSLSLYVFVFVFVGSELLQVVLTPRSSCGTLTQQVSTSITIILKLHTILSCMAAVCGVVGQKLISSFAAQYLASLSLSLSLSLSDCLHSEYISGAGPLTAIVSPAQGL